MYFSMFFLRSNVFVSSYSVKKTGARGLSKWLTTLILAMTPVRLEATVEASQFYKTPMLTGFSWPFSETPPLDFFFTLGSNNGLNILISSVFFVFVVSRLWKELSCKKDQVFCILLALGQSAVILAGNTITLLLSIGFFHVCLTPILLGFKKTYEHSNHGKDLSSNAFFTLAPYFMAIELTTQVLAYLSQQGLKETWLEHHFDDFESTLAVEIFGLNLGSSLSFFLCLYTIICVSLLLKTSKTPLSPFSFIVEIPLAIAALLSMKLSGNLNKQLYWILALTAFFLGLLVFEAPQT